MADDEFEKFKKEVNLSEFAASRGYALDRHESSRNSAVMRHPNGDKIIIAKNEASGDWIYFSVRDGRDHGTIIDFLKNRGESLGEVGVLRPNRRNLSKRVKSAVIRIDPRQNSFQINRFPSVAGLIRPYYAATSCHVSQITGYPHNAGPGYAIGPGQRTHRGAFLPHIDDLNALAGGCLGWPAKCLSIALGSREPGLRTFDQQVAFHLGHGRQHVQHQFSCG